MLGEFRVTWRLAPTFGLLAMLVPAVALAQTNLDQGKSAAQIFASDCAECHKAPRSLANGKTASGLADFLREHYTTSREQAAALAAYVLGGRGSEPIGGAGQNKKPASDRANASTEEQKPPKRPKPGKPEEGASANAKPQRDSDDSAGSDIPAFLSPIIRPEGQRDNKPAAAQRKRKDQKPQEASQEPAAPARPAPAATVEPVVRPVTTTATPSPEPPAKTAPSEPAAKPAPSTAAAEPPAAPAATPADAASGDSAPVPRDNIPD